MAQLNQTKVNNLWKSLKALVGLLVLAAGTVRTIVLEAKNNQTLIGLLGIVVVFFCLSSVIERLNLNK